MWFCAQYSVLGQIPAPLCASMWCRAGQVPSLGLICPCAKSVTGTCLSGCGGGKWDNVRGDVCNSCAHGHHHSEPKGCLEEDSQGPAGLGEGLCRGLFSASGGHFSFLMPLRPHTMACHPPRELMCSASQRGSSLSPIL